MLVPRLQGRRRPILSGAIARCCLRRWRGGDDNDQACTCYRIPDGCHNVCRGPIMGNGAAHRTHASGPTPLPSRTLLVGGRQARLPAKGKGDPKASAFGIPLRTWGEQAEAAHARVTATSIFFSLASPLAVVSRSGSRSQPWPTCEHCAANLMKGLPKSAKHLLEINAEFPQARPSRSSLS